VTPGHPCGDLPERIAADLGVGLLVAIDEFQELGALARCGFELIYQSRAAAPIDGVERQKRDRASLPLA
jgi:hypothetical protein